GSGRQALQLARKRLGIAEGGPGVGRELHGNGEPFGERCDDRLRRDALGARGHRCREFLVNLFELLLGEIENAPLDSLIGRALGQRLEVLAELGTIAAAERGAGENELIAAIEKRNELESLVLSFT